MRRAIPFLLVASLLLTGCVSAREVPAPMNDAELQTFLQDQVDAAWSNTGLDGIVERPESDPSAYVENYRSPDNFEAINECMREAGFANWGISEANGGPVFTTATGEVATQADQLTFYTCFAETPTNLGFLPFTDAESDYVYDYFRDWVMPCLRIKGYELSPAPTREEYKGEMQYWVPYYSVINAPGYSADLGMSQEQLDIVIDQCGAPFPGMAANEMYGF